MPLDDVSSPPTLLPLLRLTHTRLVPHVHRTPLLCCRSLDALARTSLHLKCENLQKGGAFKIRGALAKALSLSATERARGLVTYSSGNHGQGVALAARIVGTAAVVVMPENATEAKVLAARAYGADVVFAGKTSDERRSRAEELVAERGLAMVPPFDDPDVVLGQAGVGLEIVEDGPRLAAVLVPVGGGGLISGVALAVAALSPGTRIIGVEPAGAAKAQASLLAGTRVRLDATETIADGLRPLAIGQLNWEIISRHVAEVVTVEDDAIREAVRLLAERAKLVVEPSGAASVAGALAIGHRLDGPVACVVSGGNLDVRPLAAALRV